MQGSVALFYNGCFYYRWKSVDDPGYSADFYDYLDAKQYTAQYEGNIPAHVKPPWNYHWLLYQIISSDRESEIRTNGDITSRNSLLGKIRPGKISIYRTPEDGVLRFQHIRIKKLEGMGI